MALSSSLTNNLSPAVVTAMAPRLGPSSTIFGVIQAVIGVTSLVLTGMILLHMRQERNNTRSGYVVCILF